MSNILKLTAIIALVAPGFLLSGEQEDHIPVGTRQSEFITSNEENALPADEVRILPLEEEERAVSGFFFDRYPPIYYPSSFHFLRSVSALGDSVELEDGSVWKLKAPYHNRYETLSWKTDIPVAITQNSGLWNRGFKYRLVYNPQSDYSVSVDASLDQGPYIGGEYTLYAADLDSSSRTVVLNDSSRWEVCSWDHSKLEEWFPNDPVIIGFNSGWFSSYEAILINVSTNEFVRARQY